LASANNQGFSTFGYVDNIVTIVQGKFDYMVRELMQEVLNMVGRWTAKKGLSISPHKTAVLPFTDRRIIEGLEPLTLHGKQLQMLDKVKYLGVTLDSKLNWNLHLQRTIRKPQTTFAIIGHMWDKMGSQT
jgi:hypothetical protein